MSRIINIYWRTDGNKRKVFRKVRRAALEKTDNQKLCEITKQNIPEHGIAGVQKFLEQAIDIVKDFELKQRLTVKQRNALISFNIKRGIDKGEHFSINLGKPKRKRSTKRRKRREFKFNKP